MEYRLEETWRFFDLPAFVSSHGAELLSVDSNDWVSVKIPGGKVLKRARVHRAVLENRVINLPKLKTHIITGATLAMKNLVGICHDDTKRAMHILGIHGAIVDLNRVIQPALNLIDGTVGMEGDGAVYGIPKKVGMLIAAKSALAADLVGLELMGLQVATVPHLKFAAEEFGLPDIEKVGERFIPETFLAPKPSKAYLLGYRMLYAVDLCFHRVHSMHFNEYLYRKGIAGTRPYIMKDYCDACGDCLGACPTPQCFDLSGKKIDVHECLRCLECIDACSKKAIRIKGVSGNKSEI
jgi:ferredoxin